MLMRFGRLGFSFFLSQKTLAGKPLQLTRLVTAFSSTFAITQLCFFVNSEIVRKQKRTKSKLLYVSPLMCKMNFIMQPK